jgi:hypothetical protein
MKLRAFVVLLFLANLGFFAWTQGWLDAVVGPAPRAEREPERLARQLQPQRVRIVPPSEAASAMSLLARADTLVCLEVGPLTPAEADAAESLLQAALPAGRWERRNTEQPGEWIIYVGRFTAADAQNKKSDELRRMQIAFDEIKTPPDLAPGLSLGRFDNRGAANAALDKMTQRGVRSARVITLAEPATVVTVRVDRVDRALAAELYGLGGEVGGQPLGQAFTPCAK